jgi:hypothetical protein
MKTMIENYDRTTIVQLVEQLRKKVYFIRDNITDRDGASYACFGTIFIGPKGVRWTCPTDCYFTKVCKALAELTLPNAGERK